MLQKLGDTIGKGYIPEKLRQKQKYMRTGFISGIPNILAFDAEISPQAFKILCCMQAHSFVDPHNLTKKRENVYPANWRLCAYMGISERQLIRYKKELEALGLIKTFRTGRANEYEIDFDCVNERVEKVIDRIEKARADYDLYKKSRDSN